MMLCRTLILGGQPDHPLSPADPATLQNLKGDNPATLQNLKGNQQR